MESGGRERNEQEGREVTESLFRSDFLCFLCCLLFKFSGLVFMSVHQRLLAVSLSGACRRMLIVVLLVAGGSLTLDHQPHVARPPAIWIGVLVW
jgi:hypothetical protein